VKATTASRSKPVPTNAVAETVLRSPAGHDVVIGDAHPFVIIGERINPTGRKKLAEELKHGNYDTVRADAISQIEAGARVLDLNAGIPGFDEVAMLSEMVKIVNDLVDAPICIDSYAGGTRGGRAAGRRQGPDQLRHRRATLDGPVVAARRRVRRRGDRDGQR